MFCILNLLTNGIQEDIFILEPKNGDKTMNKITKTLSALTIASMAGAFSACSDSASTAGVTEEASGIANKDSTDNRDTTAKEPASDSFSGKISGVSQKGPFLVGSSITLHEIDGESFDLSGRTFVDKIKNDNGEFEISYKELSSKYALFIANGYYRNEVSGAKSTAPITLNALSDLSERSSANVNLAPTHYRRNGTRSLRQP